MDSNVRALTFRAWAEEKSQDDSFLYGVYRQLDQKGLFPPGMDKLSVKSAPCFVKMAAGGLMEGPTVMAIIKKITGAYERELAKRWEEEKGSSSKEA